MSRYSPRRVRGLLKLKPNVFSMVVWWLGTDAEPEAARRELRDGDGLLRHDDGVARHVGDDGGAHEDAAGLRARCGECCHGVGAARSADGHPHGGDARVLGLLDARDG